jgi:hypothetical protein
MYIVAILLAKLCCRQRKAIPNFPKHDYLLPLLTGSTENSRKNREHEGKSSAPEQSSNAELSHRRETVQHKAVSHIDEARAHKAYYG